MAVRWGPETPPRYAKQSSIYVVGDYLIAKEAEGTVDTIEWSISFNTWCYRVTGKKFFWLYQTDRTLKRRGDRRPPPLPPLPLPDPISIME